MAPSRRKSKAPSAAAVAARQKWKVGDLVLAKVKGFPAWPATVSEPEKWGYKPDSKKVFVFFFGTKQIAFCSHLDVETFTEEKKQSIQGKRYGKCADFVRAVQEIIESYDEMKMHAQNDVLNSGAEITVTNGEDSVGLPFNSETKDQMHDTPELLIPKQNGSVSMKDKLEASRLLEGEKQTDMTVISGTPLESPFVLRKKPEGMSSLADVKLGRAHSARRSRTSRIDVSKQRDSESPSESIVAGTRNIESSALCNGSLRKTNPGISALGDEKHVDLFCLVSNFSHESNANRIASPEFRSINMTEGNSMDSTCVPEHNEAAGNLSENVGLTKKHGLDIKAVFVKKKRIRNSKRFATDSQEMTSSVDKVADLVFGAHNRRLKSPNACEKSDESPPNVEGDEYLPLVKRARVRMSKLSDAKGHVDTLMLDVDEKPPNGCPLNVPNGLSLNSLNNFSSKEHDLNLMKESTGGGSEAKVGFTISANEGQPDNFCMSLPCDSVDGEAGLPPSNLLYRASEAMSVTAPEDSQSCAEEHLLKSSAIILSSISSMTGAAAPITKCDAGKDLLGTNVNVACNNDMEVDVSTNAASMNPPCIQESEIPSTNTAEFNQCSGSSPAKEEAGPCYAVHNDSGVKCFSLDTNDRNECHLNNMISGDQSLQFNETRSSDSNQGIAEPPDHKLSSSDSTEVSECMVRKDDDDMSKIKHDPDICCEDENLQLPKMLAHSMSALDGELKVDASLKSGPSIVVEDTHHDLSHLATASGEKNVLRVQIITSSISGPLQPSPLSSSSLRPIGSTPKGSDLHNNGFVGPADKVPVKREESTVNPDAGHNGIMRSSGKVSNYVEAKGSLTSFENALGTLTRTKDSIGRATRMAIECAKAGLAAKVVDILSRTLENESNLNRKVDLFFLVDSMMQCSRGLKGVVGGIYPSAIQAALPRLLSAAAPAGNAANENRRQCSKVLKLWLERRILPETVIRHHMRILESFSSDSYSSDPLSRRSSRTERACHDPLREMEGMLVDEYGSNSSFQLSGFCMPRMRKDDSDGSDSDGGSFEAVTPEHNLGTPDEPEHTTRERRRHILEDVDGELEMEDVAPSEAEMDSSDDVGGISTQIAKNKANATSFSGPPLPSDVPPSSPPLPTSPPPSHTHHPPLPRVPHQNHSMPAPLQPPPLIPAPYPACLSHCHSLPTASDRPLPPQPSMHPFPPSVSGCPPPVYLPIPVQPSTDMIANGTDSMHYSSRNNLVHSLPPASPHTQQIYGDSMDHRASDRHNTQRQMGIPEPSTSCSFNSFTGPHHAPHPTNSHSVHPSNGIRHSDNYDARPPSLGPPNNFTSVQGDQRAHNSWREGPLRSYSNNYHRGPSRDDRRYHYDHNWRKPGSQELYDDRRYYGPPFVGDKGGGPYPPHPYAGPSDEHNRGRQGWGYPPREMPHRNSMSVKLEGPRYWRQ